MKQLLRAIIRYWNKSNREAHLQTQRFEVLEYYLKCANCDMHLRQYDALESATMRAKDKTDLRYYKLSVDRGIKEAEINKTIIHRQLNLCSN